MNGCYFAKLPAFIFILLNLLIIMVKWEVSIIRYPLKNIRILKVQWEINYFWLNGTTTLRLFFEIHKYYNDSVRSISVLRSSR